MTDWSHKLKFSGVIKDINQLNQQFEDMYLVNLADKLSKSMTKYKSIELLNLVKWVHELNCWWNAELLYRSTKYKCE